MSSFVVAPFIRNDTASRSACKDLFKISFAARAETPLSVGAGVGVDPASRPLLQPATRTTATLRATARLRSDHSAPTSLERFASRPADQRPDPARTLSNHHGTWSSWSDSNVPRRTTSSCASGAQPHHERTPERRTSAVKQRRISTSHAHAVRTTIARGSSLPGHSGHRLGMHPDASWPPSVSSHMSATSNRAVLTVLARERVC